MLLPRDEKLAACSGSGRPCRHLNEVAQQPRATPSAGAGQLVEQGHLRRGRRREPAIRGAHGRRHRRRAGPRPLGRPVRHRRRRRAAHQLRIPQPGAGVGRGLESPSRSLAGLARRGRGVRRRRPPRPAGLVQLRHRAAGRGGPAPSAPAPGGGDPSDDRRAGPTSTGSSIGAGSKKGASPISSCSTRETVASHDVAMRFDLPGGAGRLYAEADGIEHVFVNGRRSCATGGSPKPVPGPCCAPAATLRPRP